VGVRGGEGRRPSFSPRSPVPESHSPPAPIPAPSFAQGHLPAHTSTALPLAAGTPWGVPSQVCHRVGSAPPWI